ncbi:MAG: HAMP domain-containing histidine kinase [Actinomycetales bacterium]|nr:HAMP domain-containing histidine kinase [Actinomycetales bacterium]
MRRRMWTLMAATTSAVILAFLLPLLLLLHTLAEDRALDAAVQEAQRIAVLAANVTDPAELATLVELVDAESPRSLTVVMPGGEIVGAAPAEPVGVRTDDQDVARARAGAAFVGRTGDGAAAYVPAITSAGTAVVRSRVPESELHRGVGRATATIVGLGLLLLVGAMVTADRLARTVSAPFHDLAAAADAMREGELATRVPERGVPEAVALARALNRLAARVVGLLAAERDSVADLSHRLRTPVTALRLDVEGVTDPDVAERLHLHLAHLERTVDAIVHDARRPVRSAVTPSGDVAAVVAERIAFWTPLADDQARTLTLDLPAGPAAAAVDPAELRDVVDVLLDNVFAHTAEGVRTAVTVRTLPDGAVELTVEDAGPGLPSRDVVSRGTSGAGSSGLGLDIVRRTALASGGRLELDRSPLLGGARVRLVLGPAGS